MPLGQIITADSFSGSIAGTPNFLGQVGILPDQIFSAAAYGAPTLSISGGAIGAEGFESTVFGTPLVNPYVEGVYTQSIYSAQTASQVVTSATSTQISAPSQARGVYSSAAATITPLARQATIVAGGSR